MTAAAERVQAPVFGKQANTLLVGGFLGLIAVLIIPLPTFLMDLMITLNVSLSLLILMATLSANRPLEFSTFPSVILFSALFRLSLNVASTRLILLQGDAGAVIRAFGDFVVGGNYVIGTVIFLILIVIQFVVITKGQNRIAEVAARFTLDAMPGKQMAIDADLNAGLIDADEAKARRKEIARESEFYGAMDGAGKFIRGDAIAGLIITAINIVGGILIGTLMRGMDLSQALQTYTILTVGDGLVSQIPGLIVSVSSGILVTKAASKEDLGIEIADQIAGRRPPVRVAGLVLIALGLVPGLPFVPFAVLGSALLLLAARARPDQAAGDSDGAEAETAGEAADEEAKIQELLRVDRLGIRIGYRLIPIVDPGRHGGLLESIAAMRRQFAGGLGIVVPPIRVKDDVHIDPNRYRILIGGHEVASGELHVGQYLAIDPGGGTPEIEGIEAEEPAFGLPGKWITESAKEKAEVMGYTVIDAPSVLITHLSEVIKKHAHEILNREDVQALLDNLKRTNPTIVEETVPKVLAVSQVQKILSLLLKEQVPVRDLAAILEAAADAAEGTKDPRQLCEAARLRLARAIVEPLLGPERDLLAATIGPELENGLLAAITGQGGGDGILADGVLGRFVERTAGVLAELSARGRRPVLVTRAALRPFLAEAVTGAVPGAAVLSYQEVAQAPRVEVFEQIRLEEAAA